MKAQLLTRIGRLERDSRPLQEEEVTDPIPEAGEVLIQVAACGVCHTELDEIEGRTPPAYLPMILGHQVVGTIVELGPEVTEHRVGARVGVAWIYSACGGCSYCLAGRENLCRDFQATGRDHGGGYAELMKAPAAFVHPIPDGFNPTQAAPLLCAGAIGYRSWRLTGLRAGQSLGLAGFGGSAHLVVQMVQHVMPNSQIYVFARNPVERDFARNLGVTWAGDFGEQPPTPLDAIIDTTPAWRPVVQSLQYLKPGGRLVINAIRKQVEDQSELLKLDYAEHLWLEKQIQSVANVTRQDVREFLQLAAQAKLRPQTEIFPLSEANRALVELKMQGVVGAKVLVP